jgi:hypothetical protein
MGNFLFFWIAPILTFKCLLNVLGVTKNLFSAGSRFRYRTSADSPAFSREKVPPQNDHKRNRSDCLILPAGLRKPDSHRAGRKSEIMGLNTTGKDSPIKKPVTWARASVVVRVSNTPWIGPYNISRCTAEKFRTIVIRITQTRGNTPITAERYFRNATGVSAPHRCSFRRFKREYTP